MSGPNAFIDPQQRPIRFVQKRPQPIFAFGESSFPVSFSFMGSPRKGRFVGAAAEQLGTYLTDKDPYDDSKAVQLACGQSQSVDLIADGVDITTALFYLRTTRTDESVALAPAWSVLEMRQPSFTADIEHLFSTGNSAKSFDPVGGLYPAATMKLTAHRILSSGVSTLTPVFTNKDSSTRIVLAPADSYGIVDVEIDIVISWYSDENRTLLASGPDVDVPRLGLRLYVSSGSHLSPKIVSGNSCIVSSIYPTTVLQGLGGTTLSLTYWGGGQDGVGLFWGRETGINVSSNGLAIQSSLEVATYMLDNELVDYDTSSSSASSVSSLNSSFSTSSVLDFTSTSSSSGSSITSASSKSSSSKSSRSTSSSSTSSASSPSSVSDDSSSSSTAVLDYSSSSSSSISGLSSQSSSSSLIPQQIAQYSFSTAPDVFGVVLDGSGNGLDLVMPPVSGNIGPPTWGASAGVSGGGFLFAADSSHTDYLQAPYDAAWLSSRGSVSLWVKPDKTVQCVPFCISNGFVNGKTELSVVLNQTSGSVSAWLKVDGATRWAGETAGGLVSSGFWAQVVVTQDGDFPRIYVNGSSRVVSFSVSTNLTAWTSELATATSIPDRIVVGAAPRYYSPFMALGFSGGLDELSVWDEALSSGDISTMFTNKQ